MKQKSKKVIFLVCYLVHLVQDYQVSGDMLAGRGVIRTGEGAIRADYGSKKI